MWVVCCGMIRSGSTLQYQVASELVERNGMGRRMGYRDFLDALPRDEADDTQFHVLKTHSLGDSFPSPGEAESVLIGYTFRDLRDVVASCMLAFDVDYERIQGERWLDFAVLQFDRIQKLNTSCSFRYEDFYNDIPRLVRQMASAMRMEVQAETVNAIAQDLAIPLQRKRSGAAEQPVVGDEVAYDGIHLLHSRHINKVEPGCYREVLTAAQIRDIEKKYENWLCQQGYL